MGELLCACGACIIRARGGSPVSRALVLPAALPNSCALVSSALGPAEACRRRLARAPLVRVVIVAGLCAILFCAGPGVLSSRALQVSFRVDSMHLKNRSKPGAPLAGASPNLSLTHGMPHLTRTRSCQLTRRRVGVHLVEALSCLPGPYLKLVSEPTGVWSLGAPRCSVSCHRRLRCVLGTAAYSSRAVSDYHHTRVGLPRCRTILSARSAAQNAR